MSESGRMAIFLFVVLTIWAGLHAFVLWRVGRSPFVLEHVSRRTLLAALAVLWASYPLARFLDSRGLERLAWPLEVIGAVWMGVLFLAFVAIAVAEVVRIPLLVASGGAESHLRRLADNLPALGAALAVCLGAIGAVQHARGPVVVHHEVTLPGLPAALDGTVLVEVSDLHLGSLLGAGWFERRLEQIRALHPHLVAVVGDLVDGNAGRVERLVPLLAQLRAPLGVWAVTGNHEYYAGLDRCVALFEAAGYGVLRDRWTEVAPGLVLAGIDDLTARQQFAPQGGPRPEPQAWLEKALAGRPAGGTILLSHTPWLAERASSLGAGMMLSGHTHDGQIWPFGYLVSLRYPFLGGAYDVGPMKLVVCRGTGSWGPPIRLWRRSEIVRIVLRSPAGASPSRR